MIIDGNFTILTFIFVGTWSDLGQIINIDTSSVLGVLSGLRDKTSRRRKKYSVARFKR